MLLRTIFERTMAILIGILICFFAVTMLVGNAGASREVLSDLDCIVEPSIVAEIGSAVPGLLESVHYDRADFVPAGAVMAELESGVERAALTLADRVAELSTAIDLRRLNAGFGARTKDRNQKLFNKSSISSQSMDQVRTEARIAALQVRQEQENQALASLEALRARAALKRRTILSPFAGSIIKRFKTVGEFVEGEPVFELAQLDPLHVEVILPLEHLHTVTSGMRGAVTLIVPSMADEELTATVRRIDSLADAASGTYGVQLELPNPELNIPAGVRCQVDFLSE